jgi:nucleoside 2-deoxyribosyltransferase
MSLNIIGGTYHEICKEPEWDELYGSGLRAAFALAGKNIKINLFTYADAECIKYIDYFSKSYKVDIFTKLIDENVRFEYVHPLSNPIFYPETDSFQNNLAIQVGYAENSIVFGMIEGNAVVSGRKVVYDPQSPYKPQSFWENGSKAEELILVLNMKEATALSGSYDIDDISEYLLKQEKALAAIIKCGAEGAYLLQPQKSKYLIPSYITNKVWPIGTGDIFTSYFGYQWMINNTSLEEAANLASQATAYYANSITLPIPLNLKLNFESFLRKSPNKKKVYLAGPFFTMAERWIIDQFRNALISFNIDVFSPLHEVGLGKASDVVGPDLEGINNCELIIAILDGLDSGTLFEIGYAKAKGKTVIVFVENEKPGALTMLEGTNCIFESDFSSCVYKTFWELYK